MIKYELSGDGFPLGATCVVIANDDDTAIEMANVMQNENSQDEDMEIKSRGTTMLYGPSEVVYYWNGEY